MKCPDCKSTRVQRLWGLKVWLPTGPEVPFREGLTADCDDVIQWQAEDRYRCEECGCWWHEAVWPC